ncbi:MAG: M3 family oligoendopeptidase, partial [Bacilli bacterium]|nr:M3 family oligoendopeptidase [Bacilli bacterium]
MKFEEMPVRIPNLKKIQAKLGKIKERLENAQDEKEALKAVKAYFDYNDDLETDVTIISIKYSINTTDEAIAKANDVVDEIMPVVGESIQEFEKVLFNSKFRPAIEAKYGSLLFKRIEVGFKTFSPEIVPELVQENKLSTEYSRLMASAKLEFNGEILNLMQIGKYLSDKDPEVRMAAAKKYYGFLEENDEKIGQIYDELVKLRDTMAHKLGFKNFVDLGYLKLGRLDYNSEMVHGYREQIKKDVVPVVKKLRKRQAERIGIKNPIWLDYNLDYLSGNAKPIGDSATLVKAATKMYDEMSPESGKFFRFMVENNLMDLDAKAGKSGGGYMTYIPRYKSPFIFANSNGTSQDVDTLTHEVGHAFQGYLGANIKVPAERMPTLEACEIDSMSMEFFAWPWM